MKLYLLAASTLVLVSACSNSAPNKTAEVMMTKNVNDVAECVILSSIHVEPQSLAHEQGQQDLAKRALELQGNALQIIPLPNAEPEVTAVHVYRCSDKA